MVMILEDYDAEITLSSASPSELLDWSSFEVTTRHREAEIQFSVELKRPINLDIGDTISISDGFANTLIPLVVNKEVEGSSGSMAQTRISGKGSLLTRRGPVKDIVYVNQTWLQWRCPGYYVYETGNGPTSYGYSSKILMATNPGTTPFQFQGVSQARLFLDELPGKDIQDSEFGVILQSGITYWDIGRAIARMCGYDLYVNVPNMPVQKTYTIHQTQTFWQSLVRLFNDWKPMMFIKGTTIYVVDVGRDRQAKTGGDTIQLSEDSFTLYQWNVNLNEHPIDHLMITGPSTQYTYASRSTMHKKRQYTAVTLPGQTITQQFEDGEVYEGSDGIAQTLYVMGAQDRCVRTLRTTTKKVDFLNPENEAIITDREQGWDINENLLYQIDTTYSWASFSKMVKKVVEHSNRIGRVGGGQNVSNVNGVKVITPITWDFSLVSRITTTVRDYYEDINQVELDIVEEGLCYYYKDTEKLNGEDVNVYDQMQPWWQAAQSGVTLYEVADANGNGPAKSWQNIKQETVRLDKQSSVLYRKTRKVTTFFPYVVTKYSSEDIPIPVTKQVSQVAKKWEYYWVGGNPVLYTSGHTPAGSWHPRYDIYNPDLVDASLAEKMAWRNFTAAQTTLNDAVIETTVPIPNIFIGATLALPACTKEIFDQNTNQYVDIQIAAKTYWVVGHTRRAVYSGEVGDSQREIRVNDRIELKEYY